MALDSINCSGMREHNPVLLEEFNGLWRRGDAESCPIDHFSDCNNIAYIQSGFQWRDGANPYKEQIQGINIERMFPYTYESKQGLLILDDKFNIYDASLPKSNIPILTVNGMTDFAAVNFSNRVYISPHDGKSGLQGEFLYVYMGDGVPARKAGGAGPVGTMSAAISPTAGNVEPGYHIFGVVYETDTGFLTKIGGQIAINVTTNNKQILLSNIPVSPDPHVKKRHIVATKALDPTTYTGDVNGYLYYTVPGGNIDDNTSTTKTVNFFDADLLEDKSDLLDAYESIPAGVGLNFYHNRLLNWNQFGAENPDPKLDTLGNHSRVLVSAPGEPESINQVDGLIVAPLDGYPINYCQEYRDTLYVFKATKTLAYTDNGDSPSGWPLVIIDQGIGSSIHGVATVLDSGGVNIDFLVIADFSGIMIFNGSYQRPELSWKVLDLWMDQIRDKFNKLQIVNDSINQMIYCILVEPPEINGSMNRLLVGDYKNGMDPEKIRWSPWSFNFNITTLALLNLDTLVFGTNGNTAPLQKPPDPRDSR